MTMRSAFLGLCAIITCATASAAETAYVIDKLLVGVHQDQDLNSAIVKVLPTGTKLEVVKREGELALVRDADGMNGWVDAAYLMEEAPAALRAKQLAEENAALVEKLAAATTATAAEPSGEVRDGLAKENTDLKRKLSAEKLKASELQSKIGELETKLAKRPTTPTDALLGELEQDNQRLTRELERTVQENSKLKSEIDDHDGPSMPVAVANSLSATAVLSLLLLIVLAFGAGIYVMDYLNRRRHGGFRI